MTVHGFYAFLEGLSGFAVFVGGTALLCCAIYCAGLALDEILGPREPWET